MNTQIIEKGIYSHNYGARILKCAHILVGRQFVTEVTFRHVISRQTV